MRVQPCLHDVEAPAGEIDPGPLHAEVGEDRHERPNERLRVEAREQLVARVLVSLRVVNAGQAQDQRMAGGGRLLCGQRERLLVGGLGRRELAHLVLLLAQPIAKNGRDRERVPSALGRGGERLLEAATRGDGSGLEGAQAPKPERREEKLADAIDLQAPGHEARVASGGGRQIAQRVRARAGDRIGAESDEAVGVVLDAGDRRYAGDGLGVAGRVAGGLVGLEDRQRTW